MCCFIFFVSLEAGV